MTRSRDYIRMKIQLARTQTLFVFVAYVCILIVGIFFADAFNSQNIANCPMESGELLRLVVGFNVALSVIDAIHITHPDGIRDSLGLVRFSALRSRRQGFCVGVILFFVSTT